MVNRTHIILPRLHTVFLVATVVWALFWAAFAALTISSEGWDSAGYGIGAIAVLAIAVAGAWTRTVFGSLLIVFLGLWGISFFANASAFWMFSVPAIAIGIGLLLTLRLPKRAM
jgi:hypothetical protein